MSFSIGIAELEVILFILFGILLLVYPWIKILEKAGKSRALVIFLLIPFGFIILSWYLAISEWNYRYKN